MGFGDGADCSTPHPEDHEPIEVLGERGTYHG